MGHLMGDPTGREALLPIELIPKEWKWGNDFSIDYYPRSGAMLVVGWSVAIYYKTFDYPRSCIYLVVDGGRWTVCC